MSVPLKPRMGNMQDMAGMQMDSSQMNMFFYESMHTVLFSPHWAPSTTGEYAGTCVFLILLTITFRGLHTYKAKLEQKWRNRDLQRRYIVVAGTDSPLDEASKEASEMTTSVLTTRGVDERVRIVQNQQAFTAPWRLSVDVPRALLFTVIVGVGYLLMLAVMTMNVGYFLSVLAGAFLGDLFMGRIASGHGAYH